MRTIQSSFHGGRAVGWEGNEIASCPICAPQIVLRCTFVNSGWFAIRAAHWISFNFRVGRANFGGKTLFPTTLASPPPRALHLPAPAISVDIDSRWQRLRCPAVAHDPGPPGPPEIGKGNSRRAPNGLPWFFFFCFKLKPHIKPSPSRPSTHRI